MDMRRIVYLLLMAVPLLASCDRKKEMVRLAEMNVCQGFDESTEVRIIAVSEPDSAFGTGYFTQAEVRGLATTMQKVSEDIMKRTHDMTVFDPEDHYVMNLAERQMRAMTEIRSLIHLSGRKGDWSGWKIKVDYEAKEKDGLTYRAERWLFLDKKGKIIFKTLELPIP